ncbi:MAG: RNA polymerase sigma factor [Thermoleophilaceae bacterium]
MSEIAEPVERAWREERAGVVATLARRLGDLQLAEDAVQEAFAAAATRWPVDGVPDRPGAWLTTTAWRKALDVVRRECRPAAPADALPYAAPEQGIDGHEDSDLKVEDDLLTLILTCCHPSLASEARVALTLRHVAGLTTREIAAAFLVSEATMAKRLVRARGKIRAARISFAMPDRHALFERLADVHAVLYLIFTEGHLASGDGPAVRAELCDEAVWLARQLRALLPKDLETTGLLALLLLQHARTPVRQDGAGRLVPYGEQDRGRWDAAAIAEARTLLSKTGGGPLGPYQVQAAIALLHAHAPDAEGLNWSRVADLYGVLARLSPSPVVEVNRAYAVGRADGAPAGLAVLAPVLADGRLDRYAPLHAVHADLLERAGDAEAARAAWHQGAEVADNPGQRAEMLRQARA